MHVRLPAETRETFEDSAVVDVAAGQRVNVTRNDEIYGTHRGER
jgi:hypothetical protein